MDSQDDFHQAAVKHYHKIRLKYGLDAVATCIIRDAKKGYIRGRKADPDNLKPKQNHFSYPPTSFCKSYGRANIPGFPVFYAGETPETVAEEIRLLNHDWVHFAVFYTPEPVTMEALLLLHDGYNGNSKWAEHRNEIKKHVMQNPKRLEKNPLIWERIQNSAQQFRVENYQDTSSISHFWLYEKGIDAIIYPSLRKDTYCNFALSPSFVDTYLKLYRVYTCQWIDGKLQAHYTGQLYDTEMVWNDFSQDDYNAWHAGFNFLISGK